MSRLGGNLGRGCGRKAVRDLRSYRLLRHDRIVVPVEETI